MVFSILNKDDMLKKVKGGQKLPHYIWGPKYRSMRNQKTNLCWFNRIFKRFFWIPGRIYEKSQKWSSQTMKVSSTNEQRFQFVFRWLRYKRRLESEYWLVQRQEVKLLEMNKIGGSRGSSVVDSSMLSHPVSSSSNSGRASTNCRQSHEPLSPQSVQTRAEREATKPAIFACRLPFSHSFTE